MILNDLIENTNFCPECQNSISSLPESGDLVCHGCGIIVGERIIDISHSGIRAFTKSEIDRKEQTGSPITSFVPALSLVTTINKKEIINPDLKRAAKWNTRLIWNKKRVLITVSEIKRITCNLGLSNRIKKLALELIKTVIKRKLLKGRSLDSMIVACIYYACRFHNNSSSIDDILSQSDSRKKTAQRSFRLIIRDFNLKVPILNPTKLIPDYINKLGLPMQVENFSIKLLKQYISTFFLGGENPKGLCAAVIYLSCKFKTINKTQGNISSVIGITEVTLRARLRDLRCKLKLNF